MSFQDLVLVQLVHSHAPPPQIMVEVAVSSLRSIVPLPLCSLSALIYIPLSPFLWSRLLHFFFPNYIKDNRCFGANECKMTYIGMRRRESGPAAPKGRRKAAASILADCGGFTSVSFFYSDKKPSVGGGGNKNGSVEKKANAGLRWRPRAPRRRFLGLWSFVGPCVPLRNFPLETVPPPDPGRIGSVGLLI